ncbi:Cyclin [Melia azedarach]|uniref:Cyclin n=1 Tax=Melia azedarach TaxID=155640 RepID=A0ACC1YKZ9_MELAZ|nr:Cyclin [Melia azedarach]
MEGKAVVPRQPRGGDKMKNEAAQAQGKNRQVLRDIGNLETLQVVEGKISRPMTRSYRAQLLANVQVVAEKNKNLVDDGVAATRKGKIVKKAAEPQKKNAKGEKVIVISSDEEENVKEVKGEKELSEKRKPENMVLISHNEEEKVKPVGGQTSVERSSRRKVKTLTSILTARSKIACGITKKPKDLMVNIDAADVNDELAVVEYVDDMYKFYKLTEDESRVQDYMVSQPNINAKMRTILVDWLIEVHNRFELMPETLYLTINIMDRYLSMKKSVSRRELQLVGIGSMLIACKYEEIWAPQVNDFICISDYAYVGYEVLLMEKAILGELGWYLTVPTPYVFLVRYIKASISPDQEMENLVFFLAELGISHYSTIISYCPSMLAAAAVYAARCTLNKSPFWTETLKHHTGYSEEQLKDCAKLLVGFHLAAVESERKLGVYRKFSSPKRGAVALLTPAKDLIISI